MKDKPTSPAAARNAAPILGVLEVELADARSVLEIGSGTGQHAVTFAAALPHLAWQTSDRAENHGAILAWVQHSGLRNVLPPLELDVRDSAHVQPRYDAVFSANTAHIMSYPAVCDLFSLVSRLLPAKGVFCLYGPFRIDGECTTPSNAEFDESLKAKDGAMGIRDLEDLDALAAAGGLRRSRLYAMPANNFLAVWRKAAAGEPA